MPLGRPITLSSNVASKTISITATAGQTLFQPTGGYRINEIAVYRNGARLVEGQDFTARDGASVTLISGATVDDVLEFQIFDSFNIANTIKPNESTQTINGSLIVRGGVTGSQIGIQSGGTAIGTGRTVNFIGSGNTVIDNGDGSISVSIAGETAGIDTSTTSEFTDISVSGVATVGSAVTINSTGIDAVSGVITASSFVGNLTGQASALSGSRTIGGVVFDNTGNINLPGVNQSGTQNTSGTAANLSGTPDITVNNITGVAATFTGVLTYEDVTNVDSVGIVTARGGLEVGAAGVGGTVSALGHVEFVGVTTIGLGLTLADNVHARFGNAGDLKIYHDSGGQSIIEESGSSVLKIKGSDLRLSNTGNTADYIQANDGGAVKLFYNGGTAKFETHNTGIRVTGIATVTEGLDINGDSKYLKIGAGGDLQLFHNGTNSLVKNTTGDLAIEGDSIKLRSATGGEAYVTSTLNGSVDIYHNDSKKLETLSTGVKVTGVTSTTSFSVGPGLLQEKSEVPASALTGTVNFDIVDDGMVHWHYTNASGTWVVNLRGDASTTFNSIMDIGKTAVFTLYSASNNASYYMTDFKIDGVSITERWNGGTAPSAGTGSGTDVYTFNIFKTGDAAYTVYANTANFA